MPEGRRDIAKQGVREISSAQRGVGSNNVDQFVGVKNLARG